MAPCHAGVNYATRLHVPVGADTMINRTPIIAAPFVFRGVAFGAALLMSFLCSKRDLFEWISFSFSHARSSCTHEDNALFDRCKNQLLLVKCADQNIYGSS